MRAAFWGRRGWASIETGRGEFKPSPPANAGGEAQQRVDVPLRPSGPIADIVFWSIGAIRSVAEPPGPIAVSRSPSRLQLVTLPSAAIERPSAVNSKARLQSPSSVHRPTRKLRSSTGAAPVSGLAGDGALAADGAVAAAAAGLAAEALCMAQAKATSML